MSRYSLSVIRITLWILTGLLIWYTVLHFSLMALLICIYVCLFINARYVIVMTPLVKFAVKQNADALPEFLPGEESVIYVLENEIVISGEAYCLGIPGQEIVAVMDIPSGIAICTAKGVYFTIPEQDADNEEKFCKLKIELKRLKVQRSH